MPFFRFMGVAIVLLVIGGSLYDQNCYRQQNMDGNNKLHTQKINNSQFK